MGTGIEALQLALLAIALLLVGARLRVLALRRRRHPPGPGRHGRGPVAHDLLDPSPARRADGRDEWSFPDPSEPAPSGLLPSTASARRRARAVAMAGDRDR
jgi:hypothetical protein